MNAQIQSIAVCWAWNEASNVEEPNFDVES